MFFFPVALYLWVLSERNICSSVRINFQIPEFHTEKKKKTRKISFEAMWLSSPTSLSPQEEGFRWASVPPREHCTLPSVPREVLAETRNGVWATQWHVRHFSLQWRCNAKAWCKMCLQLLSNQIFCSPSKIKQDKKNSSLIPIFKGLYLSNTWI